MLWYFEVCMLKKKNICIYNVVRKDQNMKIRRIYTYSIFQLANNAADVTDQLGGKRLIIKMLK